MIDVAETPNAVLYWGTGSHRCRNHVFAHPEHNVGWLSVFGHGAFLTELHRIQEVDGKRLTRVTALEDSEVFCISRKDLLYFLDTNPSLQVKMFNSNAFVDAFDNTTAYVTTPIFFRPPYHPSILSLVFTISNKMQYNSS